MSQRGNMVAATAGWIGMAALAALALGSTGCPGPENPVPEPDVCDDPNNDAVEELSIGRSDPARFDELADDDVIAVVTGGQGSDMLALRFRVRGATPPACIALSASAIGCDDAVDPCPNPLTFISTYVSLATYPEPDGSRATATNFFIPTTHVPPARTRIDFRAATGFVETELHLWLDERGDL